MFLNIKYYINYVLLSRLTGGNRGSDRKSDKGLLVADKRRMCCLFWTETIECGQNNQVENVVDVALN